MGFLFIYAKLIIYGFLSRGVSNISLEKLADCGVFVNYDNLSLRGFLGFFGKLNTIGFISNYENLLLIGLNSLDRITSPMRVSFQLW